MGCKEAFEDGVRAYNDGNRDYTFYPPCHICGREAQSWSYRRGKKYTCVKCTEEQQLAENKIMPNVLESDKIKIRREAAKNRKTAIKENGERCFICGFDLPDALVIHHIIPVADGGTNASANLVALCPTCHDVVHRAIRDGHSFLGRLGSCYNGWQINRIEKIAFIKSKKIKRSEV